MFRGGRKNGGAGTINNKIQFLRLESFVRNNLVIYQDNSQVITLTVIDHLLVRDKSFSNTRFKTHNVSVTAIVPTP